MPWDKPWLALLWLLVCMLLILLGAYWLTRLVAKHGAFGKGGKQGAFQVLASMTIGRDHRLVLVQICTRYLLLGVSAAQMTTLAELTHEQVQVWLDDQANAQSQQVGFAQTLSKLIQEKKRR